MRRGITPVVAIALLLGMTVAASGGAYTFISQAQQSAQEDASASLNTGIAARAIRCDDTNVTITLSNTGDAALNDDSATAFLYRDGDLAATADVDVSGADVLQPGGVSTIALPFVPLPGRRYGVELRFPDDGVTVERTCRGRLSHLVARWDFESKISGAVTDAARNHDGVFVNNEKDGSFNGDPQWVDGRLGPHGLAFDGGDSVEVPHSSAVNITAPFSVVTWASMKNLDYASGSARLHFFLTKGGPGAAEPGWALGYDNRNAGDDNMRWKVQTAEDTWGTGVASSEQFSDGELFQMAMTVTTSAVDAYLDGGLIGTADISAKTLNLTSTHPVYIGRDSLGRRLDGTVHTARIYDRVLSDSEVADLHTGADIRDGLVAEWTFDEGSGSTVHDTSKWVAARDGLTLDFDGINDSVSITPIDMSHVSENDSFAIAGWFRTPASGTLFGATDDAFNQSGDSNAFLRVSGGGRVFWQVEPGEEPGGETLAWTDTSGFNDGTWHHVVGQKDGDNWTIYVDGGLEGQEFTAYINESLRTDFAFDMGAYREDAHLLDGTVDDVRLYDRALTPAQIAALYEAGG